MSITQRLKRHNSNHRGFTGRANDWTVIHSEEFDNVSKSRLKEKKIKSRGAVRYINDRNE